MPAKALVLKCEGVASHTIGKIVDFTDTVGSLFASYFFGTDYLGSSLRDRSSHGRDLTSSGGVAMGTSFATVGGGSLLTLPFSGAALAAAHSAMTIIAIHRTLAANATMLVSNYVNGSTPAVALGANTTSAVRAYAVGATAQGAQVVTDANRGAQFVMSAGVWTPTTVKPHYTKNGAATHGTSTAWTSTAPFGGAGNLTIGSLVSGFTGLSDVAAVLIYNDALSDVQIDAIYAQIDALLPALNLTP